MLKVIYNFQPIRYIIFKKQKLSLSVSLEYIFFSGVIPPQTRCPGVDANIHLTVRIQL